MAIKTVQKSASAFSLAATALVLTGTALGFTGTASGISGTALGQYGQGAGPGTIRYVQGQAARDGKPLVPGAEGRIAMQAGQMLSTGSGHVANGVQTLLLKRGVYGFDAKAGELKVYDGKAAVSENADAKWINVKEGHELALGGTSAKPAEFDATQDHADLGWGGTPGSSYGSGYGAYGYGDGPAFSDGFYEPYAYGFYPGFYPGLYGGFYPGFYGGFGYVTGFRGGIGGFRGVRR